MAFFDAFVPTAEPGGLLWLTSEVSSLMEKLSDFPKGSPEWQAHSRKILTHRTALAESTPETNLDLLMLAFTARQAVWMLENMKVLSPDKDHTAYWAAEASRALVGMQFRLEQLCGATTDDLDLDLGGGPIRRTQ